MFIKRYLIIIVLLSLNLAFAQENGDGGLEASVLNLTIKLDKQEVWQNQELNIYFEFINKGINNGSKAQGIEFRASFSKLLAMPREEIKTEYKECGLNNELEICSSNFTSGDCAKIEPDGTIFIKLQNLSAGENKKVTYKTKYIGNTEKSTKIICSNWRFYWTKKHYNSPKPFIPEIKQINNRSFISFEVKVDPECNITRRDGLNCTMFRYSRVIFFNNVRDLENNTLNISYRDRKIGIMPSSNLIENGSQITDLGIHQFLIEAHSNDVDHNGSGYFETVDLIEYHKKDKLTILYLIMSLIIAFFICSIILLILKSKFCKNNISSVNSDSRRRLIKYLVLLIVAVLIITYLYYNFIYVYGDYKSLIWLYFSAVIFAFCLSMIYVFYDMYIFCWEDDEATREYLSKNYCDKWIKTAECGLISLMPQGITYINPEDKKNTISLKLNDEKTEVVLETNNGIIDRFIARTENNKLNIYCKDKLHRVFNIKKFMNIMAGMFIGAMVFHYLLPNILHSKISYIISLILGIYILLLILKTEQDDINIKVAFIIVSIVSFILLFLIIDDKQLIAFKPRFEILELMTIEIMEVIFIFSISYFILNFKELLLNLKLGFLDLLGTLRNFLNL